MGRIAIHRIKDEKGFRMQVYILHDGPFKTHKKRAMIKRRFEIAYYECGLTKRKTRRFFFELSAYLYKGWLDYLFNGLEQVEIKELQDE